MADFPPGGPRGQFAETGLKCLAKMKKRLLPLLKCPVQNWFRRRIAPACDNFTASGINAKSGMPEAQVFLQVFLE